MTNKKFNVLGQLLGCYFHQDWPEEFDSDASALQTIIDTEPKEKVLAGAEEIGELLGSSFPEERLKTILVDEIGCYFEPSSLGITCEQWLKRVREKFAGG